MLNLIFQQQQILHSVFLVKMLLVHALLKQIATLHVLETQMSRDQTHWPPGLILVIIQI